MSLINEKSFPATENRSANGFVPHAVSGRLVAEKLDVNTSRGLSNVEANRRLAVDGLNQIERKQKRRVWNLLLDQFSSIVVWLLAIAALVAFFTENELEAAAILVVLLLNAAIGFMIEWQAGRALEALRKATHVTARVRRSGHEQIIDAKNLVAGDIIILSAGDRVPADARILESANLRADESTLTGESVPVEKFAGKVEILTPLAERRSMLFLGTIVVAGHAFALVTATGERTELGRIGQLVAEAEETRTPLQRRLESLGKRLVYVVIGIALLVFLAGYFRGDGIWLMIEIAISLAVAAVPEGLPAVTTLILAMGVLKMARRNAIVRRLSAVETLGSSTVICTDKTGTLTENRMTVQEYRLADHRKVELRNPPELEAFFGKDNLLRALRVGILCNEATIETSGGKTEVIGDPTETALLAAAQKFGSDPQEARSNYALIFEQPFEAEKKKMTVVMRDNSGNHLAMIKGAPSVVLRACTDFCDENGDLKPLDESARRHFLEINREMADRALRVLACAEKTLASETNFKAGENIECGYNFLGFVGMSDPPRAGAAESVRKAQEAGIRVIMLTGDQVNTARAVARELDLGAGEEVIALHSKDLTDSDSDRLAEMARTAHVFARVSPEDKLRLVGALQATGETVAVTGDGVNDAPALKKADIGIAMGERGTEVAKEASDIILTDDDFTTIVRAIEGGRTIYANIIKFVHLLFSDNLSEILVIFAAIMAGLPLPLLPLQILWINLVTDVFPALALAVEPASPGAMKRNPHSPRETLLSGRFMFLIFWKGLIYAGIVLAAYLWALATYGEGAHARTIALLSLVGVQLGNLYNCRSRSRSAFDRFFSNPFIFAASAIVVLLQVLAIYFPPLARVLDTTVPNGLDYTVILISFVLPISIVEVVKAVTRRLPRRSESL